MARKLANLELDLPQVQQRRSRPLRAASRKTRKVVVLDIQAWDRFSSSFIAAEAEKVKRLR